MFRWRARPSPAGALTPRAVPRAGRMVRFEERLPRDVMSNAQSLVRARFCQEWLARVAEAEEEPWRGRFFAGVDPAQREMIEAASRVAWLPAEVHVHLADVLLDAFGAVRAHDYYRRAFAASLRGPVLGPFVRMATRVAGISMTSFIRWAPRGWDYAWRNSGRLVSEVLGPNEGRIIYRGLPAFFTASDAWLNAAHGSGYGVYDLLGAEGIVRVDLSKRNQGEMRVNFEWSHRGSEPQL